MTGVANLLCSRAKFGQKNLRGHFSKNSNMILLDCVLEGQKARPQTNLIIIEEKQG
jgi:hypothetical protein